MATEVLMPRQGQSVESCLILEWKKAEGDAIKTGEIICEVETDKATFEVAAPADGFLLKRLFSEGADVKVLTPIAIIGEKGEGATGAPVTEPPQSAAGADSPKQATPKSAAPDRGDGLRSGSASGGASPAATGPGAHSAPGDRTASIGVPEPDAAAVERSGTRTFISPRARHLAEEHSLSVSGVAGTGPGGRIIERDVRGAVYARSDAAAAAVPADRSTVDAAAPVAGEFSERPVRGVRKLIAERMHASLRDTAQLTITMSADARELLSYRKRLKSSEDPDLSSITINDLVHFAVSRVLPRHPGVNAHMTGESIREYSAVHLAFAVDTARGLMVPVIRGADRLSLRAIGRRARSLSAACAAGNISPDDLAGGTFTVSNLGNLGVESFTPVLNPPQVAILGVCAITPKPVISNEDVSFVPSIGLSLTIDHRAVDGAPAARFLRDLCTAVAGFELLLAE